MNVKRLLRVPRMTHAEYRANLDGLNIFFGAVLGFVMAGTEVLRPTQFAAMLFITAGAVIGILYISSSRHRLAYCALAGVVSYLMPEMLKDIFVHSQVPRHLQPTLLVWTAMTTLVEFLPRERVAPPSTDVNP